MEFFSNNPITRLFGIQYPIVQGGMVWASGWRLASAVSNAGGLGLIGAGSMYPEVLQHHIRQCKQATQQPYGVNIPLMYPDVPALIQIIIEEKVPIVFTSAGNPALYTQQLKEKGIIVVHVVSSSQFAKKAAAAGCDAVVAEGFEAGGHNGREETTTMVLVPLVKAAVDIPVIAAGGIATGKQMLAAPEGATLLSLKKLAPVRLLKNDFFWQVQEAEGRGASKEELQQLLGRGRAKKGMFEGNLKEGELEIGQVSSLIQDIRPAGEIVQEFITEFMEAREGLLSSDK